MLITQGSSGHTICIAVMPSKSQTAKKAIEKEFRNRTGTFVDRPSGKTYSYNSKEVTPQMIKEQLAEEFRSYILDGKIPYKPNTGRPFILKIFSDIVCFFKTFFTG